MSVSKPFGKRNTSKIKTAKIPVIWRSVLTADMQNTFLHGGTFIDVGIIARIAGLKSLVRKRKRNDGIILLGVAQMNEQNLKSIGDRTTEEQRAITSKGGKASGEARRRRRTLREELLLMLENEDIQQSLAVALIKEATEGNASKSVRGAFETIRDTIGEKPAEKVETRQTVVDMSKFTTEEIKAMLNDEI